MDVKSLQSPKLMISLQSFDPVDLVVVARTFFGTAVVVANPHLVVSGNAAGTSADAPGG